MPKVLWFDRKASPSPHSFREHVGRIAKNFRRITTVNRNVGFFSTGYNWLIQLIPILIIAPAFMRGEIEFGVITQSTMVFTTLVAAFSLVVTQFQSLSTYGAVVSRLSRDSWHGQRIGDALAVEIDNGVMDGLVEGVDVCEGLVGEVMGLK
ncbi:MAG TPA: SbmA/BacA-like family transporter, partial [Roseiarcus sp.]|nr:SbmA/BacA-like family transporter [Roseiarcus sp.]